MRDTVTESIDVNALDRRADAVARDYPRAINRIFDLLSRLDAVDEDILRANSRLARAQRLVPASARIRGLDVRHARAFWAAHLQAVPFIPARRRRA